MSVLNELIEYQKVDADLRKIEQDISSSPERKKFLQAKKFMESAGEKLELQDHRAVELRAAARSLTQRYIEMQEALKDFDDVEKLVEDGADITFYKAKAQQISDNLRSLKGEIDKLVSEIKAACDEYKRMKDQTIAMQEQYKEFNKRFKEIKKVRSEEVDAINAKLEEIGKNIPADIMSKYRTKRKERIFPVLVPLNNDRCVCGMDFPIAQLGALSEGQLIECEHCGRFVYKT